MHKEYDDLTQAQIERFQSLVLVLDNESCWNWLGPLLKGVPYFNYNGRKAYSHLIAYRLHWGKWPPDNVSRLCENILCLNPYHLFVRSTSSVQKDSYLKGRAKTARQDGSAHHKALLTEQDVLEIRNSIDLSRAGLTARVTQRELAERYGVKEGTIKDIVYRKTWTHV